MNQDQIQGKITQLGGKIKESWGRLSDDDIALANGKRDQFLGKLQQIYGLTVEEAEKQFSALEKSFNANSDKAA